MLALTHNASPSTGKGLPQLIFLITTFQPMDPAPRSIGVIPPVALVLTEFHRHHNPSHPVHI